MARREAGWCEMGPRCGRMAGLTCRLEVEAVQGPACISDVVHPLEVAKRGRMAFVGVGCDGSVSSGRQIVGGRGGGRTPSRAGRPSYGSP